MSVTLQHGSLKQRILGMDRIGIDIQVLTLSNPGVYFSTRKRSLTLAGLANDFFADLRDILVALLRSASVPLDDLEEAIEELHGSVKNLGLRGVVLGSISAESTSIPERFGLLCRSRKVNSSHFYSPHGACLHRARGGILIVPLV